MKIKLCGSIEYEENRREEGKKVKQKKIVEIERKKKNFVLLNFLNSIIKFNLF